MVVSPRDVLSDDKINLTIKKEKEKEKKKPVLYCKIKILITTIPK